LQKLPLHLRKNNLARLLARRPEGIFVSESEQGEIGPDLFRPACKFGLEGLVSKRRESVYRGGRSPHWICAPSSPALRALFRRKLFRFGLQSLGLLLPLRELSARSRTLIAAALGRRLD
jgi:hypothetical protein